MKLNERLLWLSTNLIFLLTIPTVTYAYIGPGLGLSTIGSVIALISAIIVAILGFVWFPIRRLIKKLRREPSNNEHTNQNREE